MAIHKPSDRYFAVLAGSVRTTGGSLGLPRGTFGIFDISDQSSKGAAAKSTFNQNDKNGTFELRLGKTALPITRSQDNKSYSSYPFTLKDVLQLEVSAPQTTEQQVDEVVVGYNGIDPCTSLKFKVGDAFKLVISLSGKRIGMLGYENSTVQIPVYLSAEECRALIDPCVECDPCLELPCKPIVLAAIERLRDHQLYGQTNVLDLIEVNPILECDETPEEETTLMKFYCLNLCDTGDDNALAIVQQQYPDYEVKRTKTKRI